MNQAPSLDHIVQGAKRILPFERVVLVLQGGGALGAYQAGVYQAIHEANIRVDWICGTSIGGVNGALLAGNPPERRVERLREFWEAVTEPPIRFPNIPWFSELPWNGNGQARYWSNKISAFATMFHGAPDFFTPRPFPPLSSTAESPDLVSYYDTSPLKATLARLVDFDLINSRPLRFSVAATNVRTGVPVYFDNLQRPLSSAHVMASASLPPGFPPTEIDGEYYWDGGVVSNSPMQFVIDDRPRYSALVFQVDLWDANGEVPLDIPSANLRALEIHSASRLNITLEQYKKTQKFRHALSRFLDQLPQACQDDPDVQFLAQEARVKVATVVQLKYQSNKFETAGKTFEFSRSGMEEHWQAGYDDTKLALGEPGVFELPHVTEVARIFDVHRGWVK
ncbi:MAG: patatin-like phospholipase family protein [Xanthobacteraceae bacterium]|jgi:NTE family protein